MQRLANPVAVGALGFLAIAALRLLAHWAPWYMKHWQWSHSFLTGLFIPGLIVAWGLDVLLGVVVTAVLGLSFKGTRSFRAVCLAEAIFLGLFLLAVFLPTLFFLGKLRVSPPAVKEPFTIGTVAMMVVSAIVLWLSRTDHRAKE